MAKRVMLNGSSVLLPSAYLPEYEEINVTHCYQDAKRLAAILTTMAKLDLLEDVQMGINKSMFSSDQGYSMSVWT